MEIQTMPSMSQLLKALQHPTRREILLKLGNNINEIPYSDFLPLCENSTGKLNYHIRLLEDLIEKNKNGYRLTEKGREILHWLTQIEEPNEYETYSKPSIVMKDLYPDIKLLYKYYIYNLIIFFTIFIIGVILTIFLGINLLYSFVIDLILFLVGIFFSNKYYSSIAFNITDTELFIKVGCITKSQKLIPFRTQTNIEIKQGIFDRLLKIQCVEIYTAGNKNIETNAKLEGLIEAEEIKETLLERIKLLNPPEFMILTNSTQFNSVLLDKINSELKSLNDSIRG